MNRFLRDEKSGVYLLFPDSARLGLISESTADEKSYVSVSISLFAQTNDPSSPKPNREISLIGEVFDIEVPRDPRVYKFKFVKKEGLTGTFTITCDKNQWSEIKKSMTDEPGFLPIYYKGNSEEYWAEHKLASMILTNADISQLKSLKRLYGQLALLRQWMSERTDLTGGDLDEWMQSAIDSALPVKSLSGSFLIEPPNAKIDLDFAKLLETVSAISSSQDDIRIFWE